MMNDGAHAEIVRLHNGHHPEIEKRPNLAFHSLLEHSYRPPPDKVEPFNRED
jgi:hypothetical protein